MVKLSPKILKMYKRLSKIARKNSKKHVRFFGVVEEPETDYQKTVNDLSGALGPTNGAYWSKVGDSVGDTASLSSQPLYYDVTTPRYVTAFDQMASWTPWKLDNKVPSFGILKRKTRKGRKVSKRARQLKKI
jgi:hypothetical protein